MEKTASLYTIRASSSKVLSLSVVNIYETPFKLGRASELGNALSDIIAVIYVTTIPSQQQISLSRRCLTITIIAVSV
jgi:hypothetical protein